MRRRGVVHGLRQLEDLVRDPEQLPVLRALVLDGTPLLVRKHLALRVGAVWLIITNVQRKIASSETIIVGRPYG